MLGNPMAAGGGGGLTWPNGASVETDPRAEEAYRVLRERIDLTRLPKHSRDVTEREILASADFDYFTDLVCDEESLAEGVAALAAGAPVVADSAMVAAGIRSVSNVSEKGGPSVAVAAFNALLRSACELAGSRAGWGDDSEAALADDDGAGW